VDDELVNELIERDWEPFVQQCERLLFASPTRENVRIDLLVTAPGTSERFRPVLFCDDYDANAPLLDFADVQTGTSIGRQHWPKMATAPMNSIQYEGRYVPIACVKGTRGYHLHPSHVAESHSRETWRLPAVATFIWRLFNQWGPYQGRGV
jgi:hypothetical protein